MVMYALAAMLLPLAMAGSIGYQQMQSGMPMQQGWGNSGWGNSGWGNSGWGNQGYGVQMQGVITGGNMGMGGGQMTQGSNQWWGMDSQEDYEAYLRWCEERRMAIQEQEQQQALLREITERAEEKKREMEREKAAKEMKMKRESMVAQWRMWQAQLSQAEEFSGLMDKYTEMKIKYMFSLTMEFLKFCRCSDYTAHLQRYLIYGDETYQPGSSDAFSLDELQGVNITNVDAVAQRMASLSQAEQVKLFFGGIIESMCGGVKSYVDQVKVWESQYNFMGI